jgi:hypothetical protein
MEPVFSTDSALREILDELVSREPIFHRPEFGTSRADLENMTAPDFWEIGASGQRYSREHVLDTLEKRYAHPETSGFHCRQLGPDVFLLTYTLVQNQARKTRRSTIWQRMADGLRILFHQGTLVQDPLL